MDDKVASSLCSSFAFNYSSGGHRSVLNSGIFKTFITLDYYAGTCSYKPRTIDCVLFFSFISLLAYRDIFSILLHDTMMWRDCLAISLRRSEEDDRQEDKPENNEMSCIEEPCPKFNCRTGMRWLN